MEYSIKNMLTRIGLVILMTQVALILVTMAALLLYSRYMRRSFIVPIETLNREANDIVEHMQTREPYQSQVHTGDEIEALARSFESMSRDMLDYIDENARITSERLRLSTELDMAAAIQADQLPSVFPPFPDRTEFDIFASMQPARAVGGDFYDFSWWTTTTSRW